MNNEDRIVLKLTQELAKKKYNSKKKQAPKPRLIDNEAKQIAGVWKEQQAYYKEKNKELGL